MIIGSGLIAKSLLPYDSTLRNVCVYAAGVSNSSCKDKAEFLRDKERVGLVLSSIPQSTLFVYFSTCSISDPSLEDSPYVFYKRELEEIVKRRNDHLIVRLPQVAGVSTNPYTLLNYLEERMRKSERFELWRHASRNIIDVDDVARIVIDLIDNGKRWEETINVASTRSSMMIDIVSALEKATGCKAVYDLIDKGLYYPIETSISAASAHRCGVIFDKTYLARTIVKYYGRQKARLRA